MDADRPPVLNFAIFLQSLLFYFKNLPIYLGILVFPAITTALVAVGLITLLLGFAGNGAEIDPTTVQFSLSSNQWLMVAFGAFITAIVLSLSMAASVHATANHATANNGVGGIRAAFASIRSKSMQIFWLQCVVYALALRFSPWAALLFWLLVALAVPVALCEDLGPSDAMDRAWSLSRGHRAKIIGLEILLLIPVAAGVVLIGVLARPDGPIYYLSPVIRTASSWIMAMIILAPIQFMFVVMTRVYQALAGDPGASLHVRAASNVNS
jgi:hypothetical protein